MEHTWLPSPSSTDLDLFGSFLLDTRAPCTRVDGFLLLVGNDKGLNFRADVQHALERWLMQDDDNAYKACVNLLAPYPYLTARFFRLVHYARSQQFARQVQQIRFAMCDGPTVFGCCKEVLVPRPNVTRAHISTQT